MRVPLRALVAATFLLSVALPGLAVGWARSDARAPQRYLVLFVMDGFRPDYMRLAPMPHLDALMQSGTTYTRAWVGQLETQTPTGHATIVTGVYPRKHGVIGFGWKDATGQNFSWMPTDLHQLESGSMENLIESGGVPTLSDLLHRQDPRAKSASLSGEKYYAADAMGAGADYILYGHRLGKRGDKGIEAAPIGRHIPPPVTHYRDERTTTPAYAQVQDQFVANLAVRLLRTVRPRMLLLNLPGADIEGHLTGGIVDRAGMTHVVTGVDNAIGTVVEAYKRAGLYGRTLFAVTADHGMLSNLHLAPIKAMYAGVRATGALDLEDNFLGTGGYVSLRNPGDAPKVASRLAAEHFAGVEGALYKVWTADGWTCRASPATARALGEDLSRAYVDLCNTLAASNGPDVVLPYREDTMGLVVPHTRDWGNHGGLSWRVQHIPLVLSGPGVRHGVSAFPAQLVDMAPTLERALALPVPRGVNGVVLADTLTNSASQDRAAQVSQSAARARDIQALILHSVRQNGAVLAGTGPE